MISLFAQLIVPYPVKTQRLFELLCSWHDKDQVTINIDDLHRFLDCDGYMKANFKDFRIRVLDPAHREILKNTSLYYRWSAEKTGRKVTAVIFDFTQPETPE